MCGLLLCGTLNAGTVANVEYVHDVVYDMWGGELVSQNSPLRAANMEYLMNTVDVVNEHLNGYPVRLPEYREYATRQVADAIVTDYAISELIGVDWPFELITKHVSAGTVFSFEMTAAGIFFVDWGDGKIEKIVRDTNDRAVYRHEYEEEGVYGIKMRGYVTKYANAAATRPWLGRWAELAAISFENNRNIAEISVSLGVIFSTLPDGTNPNFQNLFNGTTLSGEIPVELFKGISGQPTVGMFANAFSGSSVSKIPEGLFSDIVGVPTEGLFSETFLYCRYLKGDLPENLFAGISGAMV